MRVQEYYSLTELLQWWGPAEVAKALGKTKPWVRRRVKEEAKRGIIPTSWKWPEPLRCEKCGGIIRYCTRARIETYHARRFCSMLCAGNQHGVVTKKQMFDALKRHRTIRGACRELGMSETTMLCRLGRLFAKAYFSKFNES